MRDHSGEQSGMFRGLRTTRARLVVGGLCGIVAVVTLIFLPWSPATVALHVTAPIVFGLLAVGFLATAAFVRERRKRATS